MIVTKENFERVGVEIDAINRAAYQLLQEQWPEEASEQVILETSIMDNSFVFHLYDIVGGDGCTIVLPYAIVEKRAKELLETIDTQNQ